MDRHRAEPRHSYHYQHEHQYVHQREPQHEPQHEPQNEPQKKGCSRTPQRERRGSVQRRVSAVARVATAIALGLSPEWAWSTPQQFSGQEIKELGTGGGEGIHIVTANMERSLDGCGGEFLLPATHPLLNQALAIALAAMYAKSRVQIEVDGCLGPGAMKVTGIQVAR